MQAFTKEETEAIELVMKIIDNYQAWNMIEKERDALITVMKLALNNAEITNPTQRRLK